MRISRISISSGYIYINPALADLAGGQAQLDGLAFAIGWEIGQLRFIVGGGRFYREEVFNFTFDGVFFPLFTISKFLWTFFLHGKI